MLTNFELPPRKFELGDKVRHFYVDESENGSYQSETSVTDAQVVGYQYQDKLWLDLASNTVGYPEGIDLGYNGWVYALVWDEKGSINFSHFSEDEINKINNSEPMLVLNRSHLQGKLAFGDVRRNSEGVIEVIR